VREFGAKIPERTAKIPERIPGKHNQTVEGIKTGYATRTLHSAAYRKHTSETKTDITSE